MDRKIERDQQWQLTPLDPKDISFEDEETLRSWLAEQANQYQLSTLLAHADDGVIWGRMIGKNLALAHDYFPHLAPTLHPLTLQECRLFAEKAELYLWRDEDDHWQARLIQDGAGNSQGNILDEAQILWGTSLDQDNPAQDGFTPLVDGTLENRHVPPIKLTLAHFDTDHNFRPVHLVVRHYLDNDANIDLPDELKVGSNYIALSRLVKLKAKSPADVRKEMEAQND